MSLEELLNVQISGPSGLIAIDSRRTPIVMTSLDARDIHQSGARNLNSLLEIYVPDAQVILHHHNQPHLGLGGIISDREDKYLYQVNGVTLNSRMLNGADNERNLPLLGDIYSIDVVSGPASATHGAGALAGVVAVQTYTGFTFQGADVKLTQGFVDQYSTAEFRYGKKFSESNALFVYYGFAYSKGADADYFIGKSFPATNGLPANTPGQAYGGPKPELDSSAFGAPWQKFHASYIDGPLELWIRYVQDGDEKTPPRDIYTATKPAGMTTEEWVRGRQTQDEQGTFAARYNLSISEDLRLELLESYDFFAFKDLRGAYQSIIPERHACEQQVFTRAIATWSPTSAHSLALGVEHSHMWFYDPSFSDALDRAPAIADRSWQTDTYSFFAEHQWKMSEQWTSFLSFRTDKNTFSDWLYSYRGTLVYTPTKDDTIKLMIGQSVRRGDDEELYSEWVRNHTVPKPETLRTYELSYDRKLNDNLHLSLNGYYKDYNAIGYIFSESASGAIGDFQIAGGEVGLHYRTGTTRISLSEAYSTLVHASVPANLPAAGQGITSAPYGFGNELAEWSPSITKLSIIHDVTKELTLSASAVYYGGFPGAKAYADYARTLPSPPSSAPLSDAGYNTPYGPNIYVNLGLEYRPNKNWTLRVDAYNLVDLVSEKLSKRNYYFRTSEFSEMPAAVSVSISYKF